MVKDNPCEITTELIDAYVHCPRKAFFLLHGEIQEREHEYSQILKERATTNRLLVNKAKDNEPNLFRSDGMAAVCDTLAQSEVDAVLKVQIQYVPCLIVGTYSISKEQRLLLAFAAHVRVNAMREPESTSGYIITLDGQKHRVNLLTLYPKIISIIGELRKMIGALDPPKLVLNVHCPLCPFHNYCRKEAENNDNLTLLEKMTPKIIQKYEKKGIFTVKQLSYLFNPRKRRKKSVTVHNVFSFELQALALRTKKIYLRETPVIPRYNIELFLDIEGLPDQGFEYLIGLIVVSPDTIKTYSFWANTQEDEAAIFRNFLTVALTYGDAPIYHYGSYEPKALHQIAKIYGLKTAAIQKRLVNVNTFIYGKVYFPSKSNRLKELGALMGATWDSSEASGLQSLVWRYRWEETHDDRLKQKLLRYNQDDCQGLKYLLDELRNIGQTSLSRNDIEFEINPKQVSTEEGHLIHAKLKQIIVSAHEEKYESHHIKLRRPQGDAKKSSPNENEKTPKRAPIAIRNIPKTGGRVICVPRRRYCSRPHHSVLIASNDSAEHAMIELFFTKSGCKKSIMRFIGKKAICPTCGTSYLPAVIQRMQAKIFGHQFQSWVVNQRIVLRSPLSAISMQVGDFFNEELGDTTVDHFIKRFSKIYTPTEKKLLKKIIQSPMVHVDETKLNILGANQYAWVLTDGSHVIFWLTQTRETTTLQKMLKNYKGVLVSDFYGGYDAFMCRQQKCLVHLLRDINEDLWKNPFNQEYEEFVINVSNLFTPIFDDVYKFGLKKRHLNKHVKRVAIFYAQIITRHSTCELVEKYRKRFERYRDSLFTFLEENGISWNNNMAERAIRHLAIQRKISGYFTKAGAERYLILLGIAQSCRFQKKSFLRFLLSGQMDVDKFDEKQHPPRNRKSNM